MFDFLPPLPLASYRCARYMSIMVRAKLKAGLGPKKTLQNLPILPPATRALPNDETIACSPVLSFPKPILRTDIRDSLPVVHSHIIQPTNPKILHVAVLGPANSGKSSLVNTIVGRMVSVVSPRAQTTRERINAVLTKESNQLVFSDTPGVVHPKHHSKVSRGVINAPWTALPSSQRIVVVLDAAKLLYKSGTHTPESFLLRRLAEYKIPITYVFSKIDALIDPAVSPSSLSQFATTTTYNQVISNSLPIRPSPRLHPISETQVLSEAANYLVNSYVNTVSLESSNVCPQSIFFVSSTRQWGLSPLIDHLLNVTVPGNHVFPQKVCTDMAPQVLLTHLVRRGFYERLYGYIPYALRQETAVWEYLPCGSLSVVQRVMVDRDGQNKIVVGKGGSVVHEVEQEVIKGLTDSLNVPVILRIQVLVKRRY